MSYSLYDLNTRLCNIQAEISAIIPSPTPGELVVVDTIIVADVYPSPTVTTTIIPSRINLADPINDMSSDITSVGTNVTDGNYKSFLTANSVDFSDISSLSTASYGRLSTFISDGVSSITTIPINISLNNGITTNTLTATEWSGNIQTVNTTANLTHYLNFSDSSSTGYGKPQKNASLSCNPSTGLITATTFSGSLTGNASSASSISLTSDDTAGTYYLPFSKTVTSSSTLYVDNTTTPLTYNPNTSTLTASIFSGSASTVALTSDNTSGTYYLPFSKTVTGTANQLYIDNVTGPLTYNPNTSTLTASIFSGTATTSNSILLTSDDTAGTYYLPFSKTTASASASLFIDDTTTPLTYNPSTSTLTATTFVGALTGNATSATTSTNATNLVLTSDNTSGTYYIPFSKSVAGTNPLFIDTTTTPLTYNPSTSTLTATTFVGALTGNATTSTSSTNATNATNLVLTSDNTAGSYYIPFSKSVAGTNPLFIDDTTGPLTYNPSTSTLTATTFVGALTGNATTSTSSTNATNATNLVLTSDNTAGSYYIPFSKSVAGTNPLFIDDTTGPLTYNPSTSTLTMTSLTTTNINATNLTASMASVQTGINFSSFAMAATGTITLTTSQFYTYVYGTPTAGQTIILPVATINGTWISITNLGSGAGRDMTIQYPSGTNIDTVPQGSATAGNAMKFVWITALSRWMVAG